MKNKTFIYILFSIALASQAATQHENCDHGDAPDASANYGISNFVRVDKMSMEAINLKTAAAEPRKIDDIVAAIGKIEKYSLQSFRRFRAHSWKNCGALHNPRFIRKKRQAYLQNREPVAWQSPAVGRDKIAPERNC